MPIDIQLRDPVKLVIWDLDETFWTGTLSEGEIELVERNVATVMALNRRGIVNAICSKNDAGAVEDRLIAENGLWHEFVFPRVGWIPKGATIAQLIKDMQLLPPNVLFIDDNPINLREAEHYAPGLQTAGPEIIPHLLALPQLKGKDDSKLSRLLQYRQLEAKLLDRQAATVSNEEFLASCGIRVEIDRDCSPERERILELVNRTNQLNYSKRRLDEAAFAALLVESDRESGVVRVFDRYGDYGLCGFYSVKDNVLTDFVFSCRILHMGVENWLYQQLGCPSLVVTGEVATPLEPGISIPWINAAAAVEQNGPAAEGASRAQILLKGGCDLIQVDDFLAGGLKTELSYTNDNGSYVEWHHSEIMRRSNPDTLVRYGEVIDRLPFISRAEYSTKLLDPTFDVTHAALSLLNEYGQGLYRLRNTDFVVPYGQYYVDITDASNWPDLAGNGLNLEFLEWFSREFEFCGAMEIERFGENMRWLSAAVPPGRTLVLINGAEVELAPYTPTTPPLHLHQRRYNQALDAIASELPNVRVCDVRAFIRTREDVTIDTRHYTRKTYLELAKALQAEAESSLRVVELNGVAKIARKAVRVLRSPDAGARVARFVRRRVARVRHWGSSSANA